MKTIIINVLVLFSVLILSACNIGNIKDMSAAQQMGEVWHGAQELNENMEKYDRTMQAIEVADTVYDTIDAASESQKNTETKESGEMNNTN